MRTSAQYKTLLFNLYDLGIVYSSGTNTDIEYIKNYVIYGNFFDIVTFIDNNDTRVTVYFPCEDDREHNIIYLIWHKGDDVLKGVFYIKHIILTKEMQGTLAMHCLISYFRDYLIAEGETMAFDFLNAMKSIKK